MTDILRRSQAPISEKAWAEIDATAARVLRTFLTARQIVDVSGPHGWECAGVNTGRLEIPEKASADGIHWGVREILPLLEIRAPFELGQMELDSISRGLANADLGPLEDTASKVARFEDDAVFNGMPAIGVKGLLKSSSHKALKLGDDANAYPGVAASALRLLNEAGISGPYALVLGSKAYYALLGAAGPGYPVMKAIERIADGGILHSVAVDGGALVSTRGGDFELTVGQDLSIGYCGHDRKSIELYLTESFTFRVLEPAAVVVFKS